MNVLNVLAASSWHDVKIVMNMVKTCDRSEDSDVRWMPTGDIDPSKGRCDGLDDQGCLVAVCRPAARMICGLDETK